MRVCVWGDACEPTFDLICNMFMFIFTLKEASCKTFLTDFEASDRFGFLQSTCRGCTSSGFTGQANDTPLPKQKRIPESTLPTEERLVVFVCLFCSLLFLQNFRDVPIPLSLMASPSWSLCPQFTVCFFNFV